ncbi:MAG: hypothetical protein K6T91_05285 [Firmicutes bacterium]|nr:hypothetical protein [Bacillota bacterium]
MAKTTEVSKQESVALGAPEKVSVSATEEQLLYSKILDICMKIGLVGIVLSFIIYASGILPPKISIDEVISKWSDAKTYNTMLSENGIHHGWSWTQFYAHGDFLNLFPIAFLAGITILCYLAIVPVLFKKKDAVYAVLAIVEVLILLGAASGLIAAGH